MRQMMTVLLGMVDDWELLRKLIADRLREEGFNVIIANTKEAIEQNVDPAGLLVVDARMGGGAQAHGIETVAKLVAEGRLRDEVPVIFISLMSESYKTFQPGFAFLREKQRPYTFLKRPFELDVFIDSIDAALKEKGVSGPRRANV